MASGSGEDPDADAGPTGAPSTAPRLVGFLFRDRRGLALFLGTLTVLGLLLRLDALINDSFTVLNTLVNLGDGRLHLARRPIGPQPTPGLHAVGGQIYGRNYGQAASALPAYLIFRTVDPIVPVRVVLLGLWTAVTAGFVTVVGRLTDSRWVRLGGVVALVALLAASVATTPFWGKSDPATAALLLTSLVAGAFSVVLVYRIAARLADDRVGLALGVATLVATPVPFWAIVLKRHALVAALVLASVYCFLASRSGATEAPRRYLATRAGAYAAVGLLSWVHAPEAATVLPVLLVADLATAPRNDPRTLATVGLVLGLAALPAFLTNGLVTGNPFEPPRFWPDFDGARTAATTGPDPTAGGGAGAAGGGSLLDTLGRFLGRHRRGLETLVTDPAQVFRAFVWHGVIPSGPVTPPIRPGTNLSVVSSMPLLALFGAVGGRLLRRREQVGHAIRNVDATTWYAAAIAGGYILLYLPSLPTFTQFTVRYLHPVYPLALVVLARRRVVGDLCRNHLQRVWRSGLVTTVVVAPALVALLVGLRLHNGEIIQVHAAVNLGAWLLLGGLAGLAGRRDETVRGLPVATGVAVGVTAAFFLNLTLVYLHQGPSLVPVVESATRWLWELAYF